MPIISISNKNMRGNKRGKEERYREDKRPSAQPINYIQFTAAFKIRIENLFKSLAYKRLSSLPE